MFILDHEDKYYQKKLFYRQIVSVLFMNKIHETCVYPSKSGYCINKSRQ